MANITCIPLEILEKILINLPVKSLLSCRCVSKTWRSLIYEPRFVRNHLSHAFQPENVSLKTLIIGSEGKDYPIQLSIVPLSTLQPQHLRPACPFGDPKSCHWQVVASCDGLLCLWVEGSVYIWNPCMIKNAYTRVFLPAGSEPDYLDLGYDSTADDYKLFLLSKSSRDTGGRTETRVFSLRSESWTKLEDFPEDICNWPTLSAFVNNSFHWILYREGPEGSVGERIILSFDLSKGKYGDEVVPLPECISDGQSLEICVLNGMLGVTVTRWGEFGYCRHLLVWVMKDYYCRGEWTKILDITIGNYANFRKMDVRPFYVDENGEVKVGVFSLWKGQNRRFVHVESLISPVTAAAISRLNDDETHDLTDGDHKGKGNYKFFMLPRDKYVHNL